MGETKTDVNTTKKIVRDTLNTLGNEWYRYYSDGNVDMQTKLQTKIFNVILANEKEMRGSYGSNSIVNIASGQMISDDCRISGKQRNEF